MRLRELIRNNVVDVQYYMVLNKGGKGATIEQQPIVQPTPPVDEASVSLEEDDPNKKKKTGKGSLKIPLTTSSSVGLSSSADTGLKV